MLQRNMCKKNLSLKFIEFYQSHISPDHSPLKKYYPHGFCKFSPSCSEYTKISIEKYGVIKWWRKWIWRIIRCNPFTKWGKDLP